MKLEFKKSVVAAVFVTTLFEAEEIFLLSYTAVILHELSHTAMCILLGAEPQKLTFSLFGMGLEINPVANMRKRFAVFAAGPAASLLLVLICFTLRKLFGMPMRIFEFANLCIGTVNLIPAIPLDGGSMVKCILCDRLGILRGSKIMVRVTDGIIVTGAIICVTSLKYGFINISGFLFLIFLIISKKSEQKRLLLEKKLVLSGEIKSRMIPKYIAIDSECELLCIAERISPSYFLIAAIFEAGKFKGEMNQYEIIEEIRHIDSK